MSRRLHVLVACEYSGVVRRAFRALGHHAFSCDLLPAEDHSPYHFKEDVLDVLEYYRPWDLVIAHPPCTDLAVSGAAHFPAKRADGRQQRSIEFFMALANADAPHVAVENPVGIMSSVWRKPDQIIQPHQFGHDASKSTCLWLKNLPKLVPTQHVPGREVDGKMRWANQTDSGQNRLSPSPDRWKERSRTYTGIADGMAAQWSAHITGETA